MDPVDRVTPAYLGLDVGGTNIKAGLVDDDGRTLASLTTPTRADLGPEIGLETLANLAAEVVRRSGVDWVDVQSVGMGVAGTLVSGAGRIVEAANLPLWNGFPIAPRLAERLGRPTVLLNDANAAAFGEYWAGEGRDSRSLALLTLGTGIGCGVVESGRLLEGRHGLGGEYGHVTIQMDGGRICSCGRVGHLEAYASAKALVNRAVEGLESEPDSALRAHREAGTLDGRVISECAAEGDALAGRLMSETARYLAIGAATVMHTVDPDLILFGGGMIAAGRSFLEAIRREVREHAFPSAWNSTRIEFAALGGNAGFIGAAGWARQASLEPLTERGSRRGFEVL